VVGPTKASQAVSSLGKTVLSDKEEGRFGGEPSNAEEGNRPDPLQSKGKTVGKRAGLLRSPSSWMFSINTVLINNSRESADSPIPKSLEQHPKR